MAWQDKVVWREGMFLRAQHFQQQDRHVEAMLQARTAPLRPWAWGLTQMQLNRDLLAGGRFALRTAAGVFEDGTPFRLGDGEAPASLVLPEGTRDAVVCLALPLWQDGNAEVAQDDGSGEAAARYASRAFEAGDTHSGSTLAAELEVARPRLRYVLRHREAARNTALAGHALIGLARVLEVSAGKPVVLDDAYIPPCLLASAHPVLGEMLQELVDLTTLRAKSLAELAGQPGSRGVADVSDFMWLQSLNRWQPLLAHWAQAGAVHPETLYATLVQMAGEISTFALDGRRPPDFPPYVHEDLQRSFMPMLGLLRQASTRAVVPRATPIPLQVRHGVHIGALVDRNVLRGRIVLTSVADVPPDLVLRELPRKAAIGAIERMNDLISARVGGIPLIWLQSAPRELPPLAGRGVCFELDRDSPHWQQYMGQSAGFGIHVSDVHEFLNLRLELWSIRE